MANWALTSYRIEGEQKDLQELFDLCKAFDTGERPAMTERADKEWEGNVILALGVDTDGKDLRGFIQTYELENGILKIEAQEAWSVTDFRHLLESHYKNMKVYFITEEDGCEVYITNDKDSKYFDYRFVVDSCIDGEEGYEEFKTEKDVLEYVARNLKRKSVTLEDIEQWNEEHECDDDYINIHEYEVVA